MQEIASVGWPILRIVVGTVVAVISYLVGRRLLDAVGLERRFNSTIWHTTVTTFGEMILVILVILIGMLAALAAGFVSAFLE